MSQSVHFGQEITFDSTLVREFQRYSHDNNPLHSDEAYSRRTPFGTPVVHGILGVLAGLSTLPTKGPFQLQSLNCAFPGPLYPKTPYRVESDTVNASSAWAFRISAGGIPKVTGEVSFLPCTTHSHFDKSATFSPLLHAASPPPHELTALKLRGHYATDSSALSALVQAFGPVLTQMPLAQLEALAWVSYFCGMIVPGRQSLIGNFRLSFPDTIPVGPIEYSVQTGQFDQRFGSIPLNATLTAGKQHLASATINAFSRPEPIDLSITTLLAAMPRSSALAGRIALVTGGSRGLGATIAGLLALNGADVCINFRSGKSEAELLQGSLASIGLNVRLARGDISDPAAAKQVCVEAGTPGPVSLLINNASPPILPKSFAELHEQGLVDFVSHSLQACVLPTSALLPSLRDLGGRVVTISSSWVVEPPSRFAHYVTAKGALESFTTALAREELKVEFCIVRPPKLLTDQTNTNFDFQPKLAPIQVATALLRSLEVPVPKAQILLLDSF